MLKTISLEGYKGQNEMIRLGKRTLLLGRNGRGKSAVTEAIVYALSGRVPAGKLKDIVASYFPPRGGVVRLTDDEGRWILRGVKVDNEKHIVSEVLETEPKEAPRSESIWAANGALLDFRHFTGLSASKRREFVLDLVGTGAAMDIERLKALLCDLYGKELGGVGCNHEVVEDPARLPKELQPLAKYWSEIWEYLESFKMAGDASEVLNVVVDIARNRKNKYRGAASEAKAALRELEAETRGATIAAGELERARLKKAEKRDLYTKAREEKKKRETITVRIERARKEVAALEERRASHQELLEAVELPEEPPEGEARSVEQEELLIREKTDQGVRLAAKVREHHDRTSGYMEALLQLESSQCGIADHHKQPIGRLTKAMDAVQHDCKPASGAAIELLGELKAAVDDVAKVWREQLADREKRVEDDRELAEGLSSPLMTENEVAIAALDQDRLRREIDILKSNVARIRKENDVWTAELRAYETKRKEQEELQYQAVRLEEGVKRLRDSIRSDTAELAERGSEADEVLAGHNAEEELSQADALVQKLERIQGEIDAYDRAKVRAEAAKVAEAAWSRFERAAVSARETYVAKLSEPIREDIGRLLELAGRRERPYLDLQNARGTAIFDLGWELDGSRRSLGCLSGGEAVLFAAAVGLAIARRAKGRRILLIEADQVDIESCEELLAGLTKIDDELDALIVATHQPIVMTPAGWRIIEFEEGGTHARNVTEGTAIAMEATDAE